MSIMHTPKSNTTTPLRLGKRRLAPPETPECYTQVTVETPAPQRAKINKEDEVRNLIVAVRIRPMSFRELRQQGARNVIKVENSTIIVESNSCNTPSLKCDYMFDYDQVFWSCDEGHFNYASQEDVFNVIGKPLLDNAFRGYNACLFAYGQTGSGKTYSMMGPADSDVFGSSGKAGVIPRFCQELFNRISQLNTLGSITANISYFEIYNEKIHDLLLTHASNNRIALKVREHPDWGPYVVDLTTHSVKSYEELKSWLLLGNKNRVTAATTMNSNSSRSHSIFSIELSLSSTASGSNPGRRSKICLVDLAGSERLNSMNNSDEKLKQGVSINKSLLTLGKVIIALADQRKGTQFVPYRDSVLTWLLRESLGGNSLTSMLATITPSSTNVDETLATLRYACQARAIVNRARINDSAHDSLIRKLNSEVERLQALLTQENDKHSFSFISIHSDTSSDRLQEIEDLKAKLTEKEEMLQLAERSWEDRYKETKQYQKQKLAEIERRKEELESHVRIMTISNEDVNLEPYQSNFLEEVENVLQNDSNSINNLKDLLQKYKFDYKVTVRNGQSFLNIYDKENFQTAVCPVDEIDYYVKQNNQLSFIKRLKWEKECKTDEEVILSKMNEIYDAADALKQFVNVDEKVSLAFAKFMKSVQILESALLHSQNTSKSKKIVTFRC